MKKLILLFIVALLMTSCVTYVKETGRFYGRRSYLKPYRMFGFNGFRLRNRRYNRMFLYPPQNRGQMSPQNLPRK